ncbi:MAG: hypothetical protein DLM72_14440 [Candidatus Nitrosopolaris wilkensis]|nr:MAG: hypothetical protein DLM72_14440 [Candidatus Nitrosopolaris wilkensis]
MAHTNRELILKMSRLRSNFYDAVSSLREDYPGLNPKKDVRITFFTKSFSVMDSVILCFIFSDKYLTNDRWWSTIAKQYTLNPPAGLSGSKRIE